MGKKRYRCCEKSCPWCKGNRLHGAKRAEPVVDPAEDLSLRLFFVPPELEEFVLDLNEVLPMGSRGARG